MEFGELLAARDRHGIDNALKLENMVREYSLLVFCSMFLHCKMRDGASKLIETIQPPFLVAWA